MNKIYDALQWAVNLLKERGIPNPILEAKVLLANLLQVDTLYVVIHKEEMITEEIWNTFQLQISKRLKGMPLQYITGIQEFMGLNFTVNENVLIPRADTEILVEKAIELGKVNSVTSILDVCTGSGCIAISLAHYLTKSKVTAIDLSTGALEVAEANCKSLNLESKVNFIQSDLFSRIPANETFDMIVSNPPYIPKADVEDLMIEVKDYEPRMALDGGEDGLDFYRKIIEEGYNYLNENGWLLFEIGYDQGMAVELLFKEHSYKNTFILQDLAGLDRVVGAQK